MSKFARRRLAAGATFGARKYLEGSMRRTTNRVALAASTVAVAALVAAGPVWALAQQKQTPGPVASVVSYSAKGSSTIQTCSGDVCNVGVTTPVNVTVPSDASSYDAHVTVSLDYQAVGRSADYFVLALGARRVGGGRIAVTPGKRFIGPGKSSTTIDYWVQDLVPGQSYQFAPDVDVTKASTRSTSSITPYLKTYRVLTRVDVLPVD